MTFRFPGWLPMTIFWFHTITSIHSYGKLVFEMLLIKLNSFQLLAVLFFFPYSIFLFS